MQIQGLFPTPIGIKNIKNIPHHEHDHLLNAEYHTHTDYNMIVSKNKRIIDSNIPNITNFIYESLVEYSMQTLGTRQQLEITQSWCTKHENQIQQTFSHVHQNSIVSGVYYVKAENSEGITFYKDNDYNEKYITWSTDDDLMQSSEFNWQWSTIPVNTGMLILFPSQLRHSVEGNEIINGCRCSLAFNTWFDGPIGNYNGFSELSV